jgi:hypothetical protein
VDLGRLLDQFRDVPSDETEQGMESRQPQIPGVDGIATVLFEIRQKAFNDVDREVLDRHLRGLERIVLGQKVKEQAQRITITSLGVDTQVAIDPNLFQ